jgi:hypothetical protein
LTSRFSLVSVLVSSSDAPGIAAWFASNTFPLTEPRCV